jgi:sugar O-acyltransferase (sialic acid O-acetyltransferase NeuD family)
VDLLVLYGQNPEDIATWDDLVDRAPIPDVYYRPAYLRAYALTGHGRPVAVLVRSGSTEALFPLLIRKLDIDGQVVRDALTPYGYGGLLRLSGPEQPGLDVTRQLFRQLQDWLRASGLVACTMRFHPLLDQYAGYGIGDLSEEWVKRFPRGQTTAVDLARWDESQHMISGMRRDRRHDARQATSSLQIRMAHGPNPDEDLGIFRKIYRETMERLQADDFFFFGDEYYDHLSKELGDRFSVINAFAGDRSVASAIFLADSRFAHYHLAGCNDEGRQHGAATLLLMAASEWAWQRGCSHLHLGGGLQPDDSLWEFKRSFGGETYGYSYVTVVGDREQYEHLVHYPGMPWPYLDSPQPAVSPSASIARSFSRHAPTVVIPTIKVVGIGAGGHAKVIIDILSHSPNVHVVGLVELATRLFGGTFEGSLILGDDDLLPQLLAEGIGSAFLGIGGVGNNVPRAEAYDRILKLGFDLINAIHPRAVVARSAKLGRGVSIMAGVVVNPAAVIGHNVILNSQCTVEHDCVIGDHVHIAPGATLSGAVQVGRLSHIGTGASVRQGVRIGERVVVGVGSVVIDDVPDGVVVVGAPARPLKVVSSK